MNKNLKKLIDENPMFKEYGGSTDDEGVLSEDEIDELNKQKEVDD